MSILLEPLFSGARLQRLEKGQGLFHTGRGVREVCLVRASQVQLLRYILRGICLVMQSATSGMGLAAASACSNAYARNLGAAHLVLHRRAEDLSSSATSTDALVGHAHDLIPKGHILWTHVTSPFVTAETYANVIASYRQALTQGHDSLMTTTLLHAFLWNEKGPLNYDRQVEKWPRTQTLTPVHEINSAVFIAPAEIYSRLNDRIGDNPYLFPLDKLTAQDIDWEADFVVAEQLLLRGLAST